MKPQEKDYSIRSVERALTILQCFHGGRLEISLIEFSRLLDLNKSTVFRMLSTLTGAGFLAMTAEGKYVLGPEIARLGTLVFEDDPLPELAQPVLDALTRQCGETTAVCRYKGGRLTCVATAESLHALKCACTLGGDVPMLQGATGRSVAAFLPEQELEQCRRMQKRLGNPSCEEEELEMVLETIRTNGYHISHSEFDEAVNALGVPIFGGHGQVIGSVSIVGPSNRFEDEDIMWSLEAARKAAEKISEKMGYAGRKEE